MNKITKLIAGLLLLAAALIGVYAVLVARQPSQAPQPVAAPVVPPSVNQFAVVVVSKTLQAGKPIPAESVRIEKLPIKPAGSFADSAEVVGRVAVVDVGEGVPVVQSHLSGGLATQIAEGERAVAVNVDEGVVVGNRVRPGDFVDVFVVLKQDNTEILPSQARLLLSRIRVLALGGAAVNEDAAASDANRGVVARTAVLAVPVAEVNRLTLAQGNGRLTLALRNPKDEIVPAEALFDAMPPVLQARDVKAGTIDPVTGKILSKALASEPVNTAFAGTSLAGLSGSRDGKARRQSGVPSGPVSIRVTPAPDLIEIIRGGVRQ